MTSDADAVQEPRGSDALGVGSILDRYEIVAPIGEGGMASVWLARAVGGYGFARTVAIKVIHPELVAQPSFREMLVDEALIAAKLHHPNVGGVFDLGEANGMLFLVLEWIDGEALSTLEDLAGARGQVIPAGVSSRIVADACAGLHAVHELRGEDGALINAVHRDITPSNVLVTRAGIPKIIDFGIVKAKNRRTKETALGLVKGTASYMPPEQARGEIVDRRADVWAMGAVLHQLLLGRPRFQLTDPMAILRLVGEGRKVTPMPASVHLELGAVIQRAMAPKKENRYATAMELRQALEEAMRAAGLATTTNDVEAYVAPLFSERAAQKKAIAATAQMDAVEVSASAPATIPAPPPAEMDTPSFTKPLPPTPKAPSSTRRIEPAEKPVVAPVTSAVIDPPRASPPTLNDAGPAVLIAPKSRQIRPRRRVPRVLIAFVISVLVTCVIAVAAMRFIGRKTRSH